MPTLFKTTLTCTLIFFGFACGQPSDQEQQTQAKTAIQQLQKGDFGQAQSSADQVLKKDKSNPYALLIRAITAYKKTMDDLTSEFLKTTERGFDTKVFNHQGMRRAYEQTDANLAKIDVDLAKAAKSKKVFLELCLACWEIDWNHNGRIDRRDERLFQVVYDADGSEIPEEDPRRKPTFRFDYGDIYWARAFIAFNRAAINFILAYQWNDLDKITWGFGSGKLPKIIIPLKNPQRMREVKKLILKGLQFSEKSRQAYLAETDDDREWLPNPKQKNHPLPLPVNEALYQTWGDVLGDLTNMVEGKEGLNVAEFTQLIDGQRQNPPQGFIDIGAMLSKPKDIVIDIEGFINLEKYLDDTILEEKIQIETLLKFVLGDYYVKQMKSSPITERWSRMKKEMDRGLESFEHKLRYLLWIN